MAQAHEYERKPAHHLDQPDTTVNVRDVFGIDVDTVSYTHLTLPTNACV